MNLLGAPIGPQDYTEDYTRTKRVEKARPLLQNRAPAASPLRCLQPHGLRLTSHPADAASDFDSEVRACLERLCTGPLTGQAWLQASLSTAAYVASLSAVLPRCQCLDPCYTSAWPLAATATALLNQSLRPADHLSVPVPPSIRQQPLSQALDRAVVEQLLAPGQGHEAFRANLLLQRQPRAGAWLHAVPCEALGLDIAPDLFRVLVKLRLRLPVAVADAACPLCDGVAD